MVVLWKESAADAEVVAEGGLAVDAWAFRWVLVGAVLTLLVRCVACYHI